MVLDDIREGNFYQSVDCLAKVRNILVGLLLEGTLASDVNYALEMILTSWFKSSSSNVKEVRIEIVSKKSIKIRQKL